MHLHNVSYMQQFFTVRTHVTNVLLSYGWFMLYVCLVYTVHMCGSIIKYLSIQCLAIVHFDCDSLVWLCVYIAKFCMCICFLYVHIHACKKLWLVCMYCTMFDNGTVITFGTVLIYNFNSIYLTDKASTSKDTDTDDALLCYQSRINEGIYM